MHIRTTVAYHLITIRMLLLSHFSHVRLCVTPWTAAHQAPLSLGFSRQEHWSGLPFPAPTIRMAMIKMSVNDECWRGVAKRGTLPHSPWECKLVQSLWRTIWGFIKELKIDLPHQSPQAYIGTKP